MSYHGQFRAFRPARVNIDDELSNGELASIKREREKYNGNGCHSERFCDCAELIVGGHRVACPPGHDCAYVRARSALVLEAETAALGMKGDFTRNFVAEMDRRAAPLLNEATSIDVASPNESTSIPWWPPCQ
jgi:hypothetical protein